MNDDLIEAAVEYAVVVHASVQDNESELVRVPVRQAKSKRADAPQTSVKTAWRNTRDKARVEGRSHDGRQTFVTELAESGAGDQVIEDLAGHVSKDMVKHYSHIRTEAKRRAVTALSTQSPHALQAEPGLEIQNRGSLHKSLS